MTMTFGELAIGTRFEFRGRRYEKVGPEVGRDEERWGNVFHRATEVVGPNSKQTTNQKTGEASR